MHNPTHEDFSYVLTGNVFNDIGKIGDGSLSNFDLDTEDSHTSRGYFD